MHHRNRGVLQTSLAVWDICGTPLKYTQKMLTVFSLAEQNAPRLPSGLGVEVSILLLLLLLLLAKDLVSVPPSPRAALLDRALSVALPPLAFIFVTLAVSRVLE